MHHSKKGRQPEHANSQHEGLQDLKCYGWQAGHHAAPTDRRLLCSTYDQRVSQWTGIIAQA